MSGSPFVPSPEPAGRVRVGVVDARTVVAQFLTEALATEQGLLLVGGHAGWADVPPADLGTTVWLCPDGPAAGEAPGPARRVDVEDLDVHDVPGLVQRIRSAAAEPLPPAGRPGPVLLSAREDAVLTAVAAGVPAARTAADLGISTRAVQAARQRAIGKLGAGTQVEAVRRAHELRVAGVPLTRAPQTRPPHTRPPHSRAPQPDPAR